MAEDSVIKDFPDRTMTVPNHCFYENKRECEEQVQDPVTYQMNCLKYKCLAGERGVCGTIDDGYYGITNSTWWAYNRPHTSGCRGDGNTGHFIAGRDHTGNKNGAMLVVNTGTGAGEVVYQQDVDFDLCDARKYRFVIYTASVTNTGYTPVLPNLTMKVLNSVTGDLIDELNTGDITNWEEDKEAAFKEPGGLGDSKAVRHWDEYYIEFTANDGDKLSLQVTNNCKGGTGNDFVLDDISLLRYDTEEIPDPIISATSVSQSSSSKNDCSFLAQFSVPADVLTDWHKIYDKVYFLWQQSTDDGVTWTNVREVSGVDKTEVEIEMDKTKNTIFRVIITGGSTNALAEDQALYIAEHGGPKGGCAYYSISNTLSAQPKADCSYSGDLLALFVDDFGSVADDGVVESPYCKFNFLEKGLQAGDYAVTANPKNTQKNTWDGIPVFTDHTGNPDGGMLYCRVNKETGTIYERIVDGPFCKCKSYIFAFSATALGECTLKMEGQVLDTKGKILASLPISQGNNGKDAVWQQYQIDFALAEGADNLIFKLVSTDAGNEAYGTQVVIDDISLRVCGMHIPQDSIYIDNDVTLRSLADFDCAEKPGHTINLSSMSEWAKDYPNAAVVWQNSSDGGLTWKTLTATGKSVDFETEEGGDITYRAIIGEDATTANAVASGGKTDGCGVFLITNTVTLSCSAQCHFNEEMLVLWKDDFGSVPAGTRKECSYLKGHKFLKDMKKSVDDGQYAVVSRMKDAGTWFAAMDGTDHTGNADGGFLVINVDKSYKDKVIYEQELGFTTCANSSYFFSLWASSISKRVANGDNTGVLCNLTLEIVDAATNDVLGSIETGKMPNAASLSGQIPWINYGVSFTSAGEKVKLRIYDHAGNGDKGNDLAIDDISLIACDEAAPKVELDVDGKDDVTGVCGVDEYTLKVGDLTGWNKIYNNDVYCLWQKSADGGETWENLTDESGLASEKGDLTVTALRNMQEVNDSMVNVGFRYRVIVAGPKSEVTEQIANQGYPNDGCYLYRISNEMTVRCECLEPKFDQVAKDFDICQNEDPIVLKVQQTNTVALDSVCWYSRTPEAKTWTLVEKFEGTDVTAEALHQKFVPTDSVVYLFLGYSDVCASDSMIFNVNVDKPIELEELLSTTLCVGSDTTYKAVVTSGYPLGYFWNGIYGTDTDYEITNLATDKVVTLKAKGAVCESEELKATVIAEKEVKIGGPLAPTEICAYEKTSFDSKAVAEHIQWYQTYSGSTVYTAIDGGNKAVLTCSPDSTRTYKVVASGEKCPSKELTVDVTVNYPAKIEATIDQNAYCLGGSSIINVTLDHVTSLRWMAKKEGETSFTEFKAGTYDDNATQTYETVTPTVTTEYLIQTPSVGCATAQSDVLKVTVEQPVNFSLSADKNLICLGDDVELKADLISGTISSKTGNAVDALDNGNLIVSPTDPTTSYTITATGTLCTSPVTKTVAVEVEIPTIFSALTISADKVCENTAVQLTASVTPSSAPYKIMVSENGTTFTEVPALAIPTKTTYYKYQSKAGLVCEATETNVVKVEVEDSVRFTFAAEKTAVCEGEPVNFSYTYKTGKVTASEIQGGSSVIALDASGTYTDGTPVSGVYTAVVTGDVCPAVSIPVTIDVQTPATLSIVSDKNAICVNDAVNITLSVLNAVSTQWKSSTDGVTYNALSTDGQQLKPLTTTWYKVSAVGAEACPGSESNIVKVDVEDSIRFSIATPVAKICSGTLTGSEIKLVSGNATAMSWTRNASPFTTNAVLTDKPTDEVNVYEATVSGSNCPSVSKSFQVEVEQPAVITALAPSSPIICEKSMVDLTVVQSGAKGLAWEKRVKDGVFEPILTANLEMTITDQPESKTEYRVSTVGAEVCSNAVSQIVTVAVEDSVNISLPEDMFICPGSSAFVESVISGKPSAINWEMSNGSGFGDMDYHLPNLRMKPTQTVSYRVTAKGGQCPDAVGNVTINVEEIPVLSISAVNDSLCEGDEVVLNATFVNDTSIVWKNKFENGSLYSVVEKGVATLSEVPEKTTVYMATATTEHGCPVSSETIKVVVNERILAIASDTFVCEGNSVPVSVRGKSGYKYEWYADAAHTQLVSQNAKFNAEPAENTTYYLVVANGSCKAEQQVNVDVLSSPTILEVKDLAARELEIVADGGNGGLMYNYGHDWTTDNVFQNFYFGKSYTVQVRDAKGCLADTTFTTDTYDIKVPSCLTPNGDGVNDLFEITNLSKYPVSTIRIYDRHGKLLLEQNGAEYAGWDGTYLGADMPSTDYWYEIWVEELAKYYTGHFTLIRGK